MSIIEIKFVCIVQLSHTSYSVVETDDVYSNDVRRKM